MADFPVIPGYKIFSQLGEGPASHVYFATQEALERKVAIKIIKPHLLHDLVAVVRFEKKIKAAARLSHSHIAQIFNMGKTDESFYIVMEYLEESLRDRIYMKQGTTKDVDTSLEIIENLLAALDYAHSFQLHHLNINPANIMFRQDNAPVLVDFGIAYLFAPAGLSAGKVLTLEAARYMSPERLKGQQMADSSDIYSLGAVLYEMLSAEKPYSNAIHVPRLIRNIQGAASALPVHLARLQPLIDYMMTKEKHKRIANRAQWKELLDKILEGKPIPPVDLSIPSQSAETTGPQANPNETLQLSEKNPATPTSESIEKTESEPLIHFFQLVIEKIRYFFQYSLPQIWERFSRFTKDKIKLIQSLLWKKLG